MNSIDKLTRYIKLLQKYNRLETEYQVLREYVKEECFEKISKKKNIPVRGEPDYERVSLLITNAIKQEKIKNITFDRL